MLTRRQLFTALAAGCVLEPDGKIWRPGERLISVPKPEARDLTDQPFVIVTEWVTIKEFRLRYPKADPAKPVYAPLRGAVLSDFGLVEGARRIICN